MKIKLLFRVVLISTFFLATHVDAANLMQVYYQAVANDPTFKQDQASWLATEQNLPITRSSYLPQLVALGNAYKMYQKQLPDIFQTNVNTNGFYNNFQFEINLTQPIFNAALWHSIQGAKADVKAATATYLANTQDLMVRTSQAYFNVLKAYNQLRFTLANKRAFYQQLITAQQQFKVGLIAVTGVYDAQSAYDQTIADEIADKNNLNNKIEDLRAITGVHYFSLYGLEKQVPLIPPKPNNIYAWVDIAKRQNYSILAEQYSLLSAKANISQQEAGHLPTFNFDASISQIRNTDYPNSFNLGLNQGDVGVSANFPIFEGGRVLAETKKARYLYLQQSGKLDFTYREVVNNTRQSFLGVITFINQIQADKQAIISTANALEATKAGYQVGTRTMTDVLNEYSNLYQSQQKYIDDQYNFILDIISLKNAAGTLSVEDLEKINHWLQGNIKFPKPATSYVKTSMPAKTYSDEKSLIKNTKELLDEKTFDTLPPSSRREIKEKMRLSKTKIKHHKKHQTKASLKAKAKQKSKVNTKSKALVTLPSPSASQKIASFSLPVPNANH